MTAERRQNIIASYMGSDQLLVHQISTGGGLNLSFREAQELIQLLAEYVEPIKKEDQP